MILFVLIVVSFANIITIINSIGYQNYYLHYTYGYDYMQCYQPQYW